MRKCFGPGELWQLAESKSIKLDQAHNLIRHMLLLGADNLLMLILFEYQALIICSSGISQSGTYYQYNWHYYIYFWHILIILSYWDGEKSNWNHIISSNPQITSLSVDNIAGPGKQNVKTVNKSEIPGCPFSLNSGALIPANSVNAFLCGQIFE